MESEFRFGVLSDVDKEWERRQAGEEPDRRFDLALDVLGDLADELRPDG